MRGWATRLEVVRGDVGNSIFLPGLKKTVLTGLVFLANEDTAERLKKCVNGIQQVLKEYELPLHEEELNRLLELADKFMASTKQALESMRGPLEKECNVFFESLEGEKEVERRKKENNFIQYRNLKI